LAHWTAFAGIRIFWNIVPHVRKTKSGIEAGSKVAIAISALIAAFVWTGCLFDTHSQPPTVIFMGNSITLADTNSLVNWNHYSGMAASSVETDYVHQTLRILGESGHEMTGVIGARDCEPAQCDGPIEEHLNNIGQVIDLKPKYVVVQLGENSKDVEVMSGKLRAQYHALLEGLVGAGVRRIFCITPWSETSLLGFRTLPVRMAMYGIPEAELVDITSVSADPKNSGDTALFKNPDVLWHPGDSGMNGIAKALAGAILKDE
jgi:hypothetical protein